MLLYHATFKARVYDIGVLGLGAKQFKNWDKSESGVVYFSERPEEARKYCINTERTPRGVYSSGVVILCFDYIFLDENKIVRYERSGSNQTIVYSGVIPPEIIYIWKEGELTKIFR